MWFEIEFYDDISSKSISINALVSQMVIPILVIFDGYGYAMVPSIIKQS